MEGIASWPGILVKTCHYLSTNLDGEKMAGSFHLEKENRYYIAETVRDLFGGLVVVLRWGSLKTNWERQKEIPVRSQEEAVLVMAAMVQKKVKRGYLEK